MMQPETVVAYDATRTDSVRHLTRRNGPRGAFCGDPLQPAGFVRYADNYGPEDKDISEADCRPCLFARANNLIAGVSDGIPVEVLSAVQDAEDADDKIVVMLARLLATTAWGPGVLRREHFPADLVRRAEEMVAA